MTKVVVLLFLLLLFSSALMRQVLQRFLSDGPQQGIRGRRVRIADPVCAFWNACVWRLTHWHRLEGHSKPPNERACSFLTFFS